MTTRRQDLREKALLTELEPLMHQPVQAYSNGGTFVGGAGSKKIRLSTARNRGATAAGKVYYEQLLGVKPPSQYSYQQSLEQDKFSEVSRASASKSDDGPRMGSTRSSLQASTSLNSTPPSGCLYSRDSSLSDNRAVRMRW